MVTLRTGTQTDHGHYDQDYCRTFLNGEYPDLSLFTLVQLRNLKRSLEDNYSTIQYEVANNRQQITLFLLAQWRLHHENLLMISTPMNRNSYKTTYETIMEYCNVKQWETSENNFRHYLYRSLEIEHHKFCI